MRFQPNKYSCALASIQNVSEVLGDRISIADIKDIAGTKSRTGTSSRGLYRALKYIGYIPKRYYTHRSDLAWRWLLKWSKKEPVIIFLGVSDHYVTISGRIGQQVVMIDPDPPRRKINNGAYTLSKKELIPLWSYRGLYWGIRVSK